MLIFIFISGFFFKSFQTIGSNFGLNEILFNMTLVFFLLLGVCLLMTVACMIFQLKALNHLLMKLLKSSDDVLTVQVIEKTSIIFDKLCDVSEDFSSFFLVDILIYLLSLTFFSTFFLYTFYVLLLSPDYKLFYFLLISLMWIFYYLPPVILIVTLSSLIEREGIRTADLIQQLTVKSKHLKSLKRSEIVMQMMTHRRPKISCGFFDLNWNFFFSMLVTIFSFGIILIQFYDVST